jgi:hypothetical protein
LRKDGTMNYLYIPTTTLNFNNILSTGSISPAVVYTYREFGYKQFEVVGPNPFKNVLMLYDRYPRFTIEDEDRENHPLVLRICTDCISRDQLKPLDLNGGVNVFSYGKTIYLNHSSTKLIFPSPGAQRATLAKSEPSLTTKLVELYRKQMQTIDPKVESFECTDRLLEGVQDGDKGEAIRACATDDQINRLKGFAWGYILGAYKSTKPPIARLRAEFRTIRNKLTALLNDPSRKLPVALRKNIDFSNETYEQVLADLDIGTLRFAHELGDRIIINRGAIRGIQDHNEQSSRSTKSLVELFNRYCLESKFYGQLDEQRLDVAIAGTETIRDLIGSQWSGSQYRNFLNDLLNNIKSGHPFAFDASDSLAMQSFAAFVLKGDDLEKLEAFLSVHSIGDFRIAFALWGAMFGFSKIPKTYYNLPIQQGDEQYLIETHDIIHREVHEIQLVGLEHSAAVCKERHVNAVPPSGENHRELLYGLLRVFPAVKPWAAKLQELMKENGGLSKGFIKQLNQTKVSDLGANNDRKEGRTKTNIIKYFEEVLCSKYSEGNEGAPSDNDSSSATKFWDDGKAWDVILEVVPNKYLIKVKDNLRWFQGEFKDPNSPYYGWRNEKAYSPLKKKPLDQRTNSEAINAFCRTKENKETLNEKELNEIKRLLMDRYR